MEKSRDQMPRPFDYGVGRFIAASAFAIAISLSSHAQAKTEDATTISENSQGVPEIVVTAQKRSERLQDVPLAITVATSDQLKASGIQNMEALNTVVPGLVIAKAQFGAFLPLIRGIGTALNVSENPTALYVDGVLIPDQRQGFRDLSDVAQINVLKGPQGTLFGRNATAGVIQVTTQPPSFTPSGTASVSYGSYQTFRATSYITGGVTDNVAVSMAASYARQGDGFGKSRASGMDTVQLLHDVNLRGKLLFQPSEDTNVTLIGDFMDREDSGQVFTLLPGALLSTRGITGTVGTIVPFPPPAQPGTIPVQIVPYCAVKNRYDSCSGLKDHNRYHGGGVSMQLDHQFDFAKVVSITSFRAGRGEFKFDAFPVSLIPLAVSQSVVPTESFTQEIQMISPSSGRLQWTAGAFYFHSTTSYSPFRSDLLPGSILAPVPGAFKALVTTGKETAESIAPYAQIDYKLTDATTLTLGGRFTHEKRRLTDASQTVTLVAGVVLNIPTTPQTSIVADEPSWRIALNHKLSPDVMVYASYNRGFKSGGYNIASPNVAPFRPETLDDWEAGLKSEFFDRRLTFNINGFLYKYKNMQVIFFPIGGVAGARPVIANAAQSTLYGIDVDFTARPSPQLTVNGGFELLHAKFDRYDNAIFYAPATDGGGGLIQTVGSAAGSRIPMTQKFVGTLSTTYRRELGGLNVTLNTTATYNGGYNLDVDFAHQDSYLMLNGSVTLSDPSDKLSLRLTVANALNKAFLQRANLSSNGARGTYGAPRIFAATAEFKF